MRQVCEAGERAQAACLHVGSSIHKVRDFRAARAHTKGGDHAHSNSTRFRPRVPALC